MRGIRQRLDVPISPHLFKRLNDLRRKLIPGQPELLLTMEQAASIAILRGVQAVEEQDAKVPI